MKIPRPSLIPGEDIIQAITIKIRYKQIISKSFLDIFLLPLLLIIVETITINNKEIIKFLNTTEFISLEYQFENQDETDVPK